MLCTPVAIRAKKEPVAVQDGARPEVWVSNLDESQRGHGPRGHVGLTHPLRDVRYAVEAVGTVFAPALLEWLKQAV